MSTINNQLNKALSSAPLAGAIPLFDANGISLEVMQLLFQVDRS